MLGVVALLAGGTWIVDGRKRFVGPSNLQHLLAMASKADNEGIDVTAEAREDGAM